MLKKTAYQIFDVAAAPQLSCLIKKMVGMQQIKVLHLSTKSLDSFLLFK